MGFGAGKIVDLDRVRLRELLVDWVPDAGEHYQNRRLALKILIELKAKKTLTVFAQNADLDRSLRHIAFQAATNEAGEDTALLALAYAKEMNLDDHRFPVANSVYYALLASEHLSAEVTEFLEQRLGHLEQAKNVWRKRRDASISEKADKTEEKSIGKSCEPQETIIDDSLFWHYENQEKVLARVMVGLAPDRYAGTLLGHPLVKVREGAWEELSRLSDMPLLQKLYRLRQSSQDSVFRHAAYRAIDGMLSRLEQSDKQTDLEALEAWKTQVKDDAVQDRLAWTIEWIKTNIAE